jgi:hypothetical protein
MRLFTLPVSALFTAANIWMIFTGKSPGWFVAGFFVFCFLLAIFEPLLPRPPVSPNFRVVITAEEIACEHPKRKGESIRWEDIKRVWYVTTSEGPWLPDEWILLEGEQGGCSFPIEAAGFEKVWDEFKERFPDFDYEPLIHGGTDDARYLCWERPIG